MCFPLVKNRITTVTHANNLYELSDGKEDVDERGKIGIGVEKRRQQFAAKDGGAPCSTGRS